MAKAATEEAKKVRETLIFEIGSKADLFEKDRNVVERLLNLFNGRNTPFPILFQGIAIAIFFIKVNLWSWMDEWSLKGNEFTKNHSFLCFLNKLKIILINYLKNLFSIATVSSFNNKHI